MKVTPGIIILMSENWGFEGLAMLDKGGRTGSDTGQEIWAHRAAPHSRSWVQGSFNFWIPTISLCGLQETDVTMPHAFIAQEVKGGGGCTHLFK